MSTAIIVSMPLRLSFDILVPLCGRASMKATRANAARISMNFTVGLYFETSGINSVTSDMSPNFFSFAILRLYVMNRSNSNTGTSSRSQRYIGSSNLNISLKFYGILLNTVVLSKMSDSSTMNNANANGWNASYRFENFFTFIFVFSSLSISLYICCSSRLLVALYEFPSVVDAMSVRVLKSISTGIFMYCIPPATGIG